MLNDYMTLGLIQIGIIGILVLAIYHLDMPNDEIGIPRKFIQRPFESDSQRFYVKKTMQSKHEMKPIKLFHDAKYRKYGNTFQTEPQNYQTNSSNQDLHKFPTLSVQNLEENTWTAVRFIGQLGNQMFELASAYGIAKARRSRLCVLDYAHSFLQSSVILIQNISQCPDIQLIDLYESGFGKYDDRLLSAHGNITVQMFLQSYKYFTEVPFQLRPRAWAEGWVHDHGVSVGIHVRRGDYASRRQNGGRPPPPVYFEYCLHLIRRRHGAFRAVVVSDDPDWVAAQPVFSGALIRRGGSPAEDMAVLAACRHVVASIGTFGWWGMRLKRGAGECFHYADPWDYDVVPDRRSAFKAEDHFLPAWTAVGDAELAAFQRQRNVSTSRRRILRDHA
jgi:galactoside 2-L-fucosyltransferase 1/2